jgi:hypothetical protein
MNFAVHYPACSHDIQFGLKGDPLRFQLFFLLSPLACCFCVFARIVQRRKSTRIDGFADESRGKRAHARHDGIEMQSRASNLRLFGLSDGPPRRPDTLLAGAVRLESQSKALTIKTLKSLGRIMRWLMLPSFDKLRSLTWPMAICR